MWKKPGERLEKRLEIAMRGCLPAMLPALLIILLLAAGPAIAQTRTTVADTIHGPDGSLPGGQIIISANSTFTAADGTVVFKGTVATVTVTNGAFSVALIPTTGSTPTGTSYSAIYKLAGVPYRNETWVVPSSASPVDLAAVRAGATPSPSAVLTPSQLPGTINASVLLDKGGEVFNVKTYGAKGDGSTDDTAAVNAAIAAAMAAGGIVYFPPGTYLISGALVIPNDGATPTPNQKPLRLTGGLMDAGSVGAGKAPTNGAILNLTEATDTVAKIDTRGAGYLEIDHLTLEDTAGDSIPFIQTTNTIVHIHDNAFVGSKNTTACDQDAIILGGSTHNIDGSATAAFQGYGSVIRDNWFNHIRRAVFLAADANGVQVVDNTIWAASGSNLSGGAAIEISPNGAPTTNTGNVISGNLIELVGYVYGIKLTTAQDNQITSNDIFDGSTPAVAGVYFASDAAHNALNCGYSSALPCRVDDNGSNTTYDNTGDNPNYWTNRYNFTGGSRQVRFTNEYGAEIDDPEGDFFQPYFYRVSGTMPTLLFQIEPSGESPYYAFQIQHASSSVERFYFGYYGQSAYLSSLDKDLRLIAGGSGGVVWVGNVGGQPTYFSSSLMHVGTKATFTGQIVQTPVAFASAPACNGGNEGSIQAITDSTVNTWGSTIAGGGTNHVLGYCDGTQWTVAAK